MALPIISGASSDVLTVDPIAKAARVTQYNASGVELGTASNPLRTRTVSSRTFVGQYTATSFRTVGVATPNHHLLALSLGGGSTVSVAIKGIWVVQDETAALLTVSPVIAVGRTTSLPTGGTALAASKFRTSYATPQATALGATASDGGGATAITATLADRISAVMRDRLATAVGFINHQNVSLLPAWYDSTEEPLVLLPGQALAVSVVQAGLTGDHYVVNACWEEFT